MEPTRQPELLASGHGRPIRIGGDVLLVKALTGIADGVTVLETVAKPGEPAPLDHVHHSYDEVFYVVEGEFEFRVGTGVCVRPLEASSLPRGAAPTRSRTAGTAMGAFSSSAHRVALRSCLKRLVRWLPVSARYPRTASPVSTTAMTQRWSLRSPPRTTSRPSASHNLRSEPPANSESEVPEQPRVL